jgi:Kef-type K+ transport system membrane component KefB
VTRQAVADLLVLLGAALIVTTLALAGSRRLGPQLLSRSARWRSRNASLGFAVLLLCALGVAGIAGGLSVLGHS